MLAALVDTHAALWFLSDDPRLSPMAFSFITAEIGAGNQIGLSTITLVEVTHLVERGRIARDMLSRLIGALDQPDSAWIAIPVDREISDFLHRVPRDQVPDMPDRIIAATALYLDVPLISRDGKIRLSSVRTIW